MHDVAAIETEKVPALHCGQMENAWLDQLPALQLRQTFEDVAPTTDEAEPALQFVHEVAAFVEENVPALHFGQSENA